MTNFLKLLLMGIILSINSTISLAVEFRIDSQRALFGEKQSGRLYVFVVNNLEAEPRTQISWFTPPPMYAVDVVDWDGNAEIIIDSNSLFFPPKLSELEKRTYRIQALLRVNLDAPEAVSGAGNFISEPFNVEIDANSEQSIKLTLNNTIAEKVFEETDRIKEVVFESKVLSDFHHRKYTMKASVALPKNWQADKQYPVLYVVTGFGGSHHNMSRYLKMFGDAADQLILVIPDASNYYGHSVFVDSENTGPWGQALMTELVPHIEKQFGGLGKKHRYVTGISSGGWSSLWLQVKYPDDFNGVWAMVPDSVDFHNFQYANLYREGENLYRDTEGNPRPIARSKGKVMLWYQSFVQMEELLGVGGQIHSFEATFSPRGKDGEPLLMFDRKTGAIDTNVTKTWKKFDINHLLTSQWKSLAPKLKGKLNIYAGELDTFYLEGAVRLLKKSLHQLGSDAVVEIVPGMSHRPPPGIFQKMSKAIQDNL